MALRHDAVEMIDSVELVALIVARRTRCCDFSIGKAVTQAQPSVVERTNRRDTIEQPGVANVLELGDVRTTEGGNLPRDSHPEMIVEGSPTGFQHRFGSRRPRHAQPW